MIYELIDATGNSEFNVYARWFLIGHRPSHSSKSRVWEHGIEFLWRFNSEREREWEWMNGCVRIYSIPK